MPISRNDEHIRTIRSILDELKNLQNPNGSFKYSTNVSEAGPFQTTEAIYPFLLVPFRADYKDHILTTLDYILGEQKKTNDGGLTPFPEYRNWNKGAVDSTAYAVLVFTSARNFVLSCLPKKQITDWTSKLNQGIYEALDFICKNINGDDGWGCVIRPMSTSESGASRPPNPEHVDH